MSDKEEYKGIFVSEEVKKILDKSPDFTGVTTIADIPTGDRRPGSEFIAPGAFKDLPKMVPVKNEAGEVICQGVIYEVDGEIQVEFPIDPSRAEAKYFNNMMSVSLEDDNG